MNRIKKIITWAEENPDKAMLVVVSVGITANLVYFTYAMKLDHERTQMIRDTYAKQVKK